LNTKILEVEKQIQSVERHFGYTRFNENQAAQSICWNGSEIIAFSRSYKLSNISNTSYLFPSLQHINDKFENLQKKNNFPRESSACLVNVNNYPKKLDFLKQLSTKRQVYLRIGSDINLNSVQVHLSNKIQI
jgi:hypothetical protein